MSSKRNRSAEYQRRKQKCSYLNICIKCSKPRGNNKNLCDECQKETNQKRNIQNAKKRAEGICQCGKPALTGYKYCGLCLEKNREYQEKQRNQHREIGKCLTCGKATVPGLSTCKECSGRATKSTMERYNRNKESGLCPMCGKKLEDGDKFRCKECHKIHLKSGKDQWKNKRKLVLEHYGNTCTCCGETTYEFLEIDHINNDGLEHRKRTGSHIIEDIIKNNFPNDMQILCANCNRGKGKFGECPHKKEPLEPKSKKGKLNRKRRLQCISHYGGKCAYCGESNWAFLEFDHINNDGNSHRKNDGKFSMVSWIIKNDFPDSIQLLCSNCNKAKGLYEEFIF